MLQFLEAPIISDEEEIENTSELCASHTNTDGCLVSDGTILGSTEPFAEHGQAVRFNPQEMAEGTPYPFMLSGCWFIAMKRAAGHIDFFFVE